MNAYFAFAKFLNVRFLGNFIFFFNKTAKILFLKVAASVLDLFSSSLSLSIVERSQYGFEGRGKNPQKNKIKKVIDFRHFHKFLLYTFMHWNIGRVRFSKIC